MAQLHTSPEFEALSARLDDIAPLLQEQAAASEELGRLTDEVAAALWGSGAFLTSIPRELGGYEFAPRQIIDTVARVAYADASAGWVFMALQMLTGTTAGLLGPAAAAELFPDARNGRHALFAGQGTKMGDAVRVDGGHRISGHWHFASGVSMASHIHTSARCAETGEAFIFALPLEQVTLIDNWDVLGLRATASIDYVCEDVFVPDTHSHGIATTDARHGGALYRVGLLNMACIIHTGWALGVGRRLLDELRELAAKKSGAPGATVDTDHFYAEYAQAEAKLRAARAWAMEVWAGNEDALDRGGMLSTEQETLSRLALSNATWSAHAVGQTVYKWSGTAGLRSGSLQRFFRDLHAGTQHVTSGPLVLQNCGKWLSGLAPEGRWVFLDLQEQG
ncbi:acyl-CoA dehydrogenase [Saccharopolyspora sp. SCSIO 74807]|uniref:acyl-CoA dehydrogenase n=1 Tax=Saccharopolyspora sp. SCSIO 74807 TaxID=3118084 RepID=UPI0030D17BB1